ncbi:50S ribosomal protein L2 [Candidatus Pacearchaeota archaeon]|nr:50S ribosomal protein L2 [Candidatus Pacearchaeota archaeon]|tara:strand:+ start:23352 stop:24050 length:699 start_codon:yes stop_codon:yes gene_type:complete
MGKRIIQQRRGHGSLTYRVRKKAGLVRPGYLTKLEGEFKVIKLISSPGHSVPIAKIANKEGKIFYNFAANLLYVGQKITIGGSSVGDIAKVGDLKNGTTVFNIENHQLDGGKFIRAGGASGTIMNTEGDKVTILMPSKKVKKFNKNCRATVGRAAGHGRVEKPILKAGRKFYIMKAKSKLWPRTSAVAMNKIDHPFGSGRGKRVKSKIAKRNAAPGKKVGHLRPRRTGRKKR